MIDENLHFLDDNFRVKILEIGDDADVKAGALNYSVGQYLIRNVGNLTTLSGSSMFGFMKKDVLILTPYMVDAPMLIYERTISKGVDTMTVDFFNTVLDPENPGFVKNKQAISTVNEIYQTTYEYSSGDHWYDKYRLDISIEKQGKKNCKDVFDKMYRQIFEHYIDMLKESAPCAKEEKIEKIQKLSKRMCANGSSLADGFIKDMGEDDARAYFDRMIFGADMWIKGLENQ